MPSTSTMPWISRFEARWRASRRFARALQDVNALVPVKPRPPRWRSGRPEEQEIDQHIRLRFLLAPIRCSTAWKYLDTVRIESACSLSLRPSVRLHRAGGYHLGNIPAGLIDQPADVLIVVVYHGGFTCQSMIEPITCHCIPFINLDRHPIADF